MPSDRRLGLCLLLVVVTSCLPQVEERATVTRMGVLSSHPSGSPIEYLEIEFLACPDVKWTIYLAPPLAPSAESCLRRLTPGDQVVARIETKPFGGRINGSSISRIGSCALRPKRGDDFEGGVSTSTRTACKWARD